MAIQKSGALAPPSETIVASRSKIPLGRLAARQPIRTDSVMVTSMLAVASLAVVGAASSTATMAGRCWVIDWPKSNCSRP